MIKNGIQRIFSMRLVKISNAKFHKDFYNIMILANLRKIEKYKGVFAAYIKKDEEKKGHAIIKKSFKYHFKPSIDCVDRIEMIVDYKICNKGGD